MTRLRRKCFGTKRATAVSAVVLVLVLVATAAAAWLISSTATNVFRGKSGSALASPTLTAPGFAQLTGDCIPGGDCAGSVLAQHSNGTTLQAISAAISGTITTDSTSCPGSNFSYVAPQGDSTPDALATPVTVPPGSAVLVTVPNVVKMATTAPSACANVEIIFSGAAEVVFSTP